MKIKSKPLTGKDRDNWERIFGKKERKQRPMAADEFLTKLARAQSNFYQKLIEQQKRPK